MPAKTHGARETRLYAIWKHMRQRCLNPKGKDYKYYGGRGITIASEWDAFTSFRDWAMAHGYSDSLVIDRIDPDKGYSPDNCRWATTLESEHNKRNPKMVTAFGETKPLYEWLTDPRCKVLSGSVYMRLHRGWDIETALSKPKMVGYPRR